MKTNSLKLNPTDARETYEMLRASHTLLRMAFGACAMLNAPENEKEAKSFTKPFDVCFKTIQSAADSYLSLARQREDSGTASAN